MTASKILKKRNLRLRPEKVVEKPFKTELEIHTLVQEFRNRTLPAWEWTHEAHLLTALWFNYYHRSPEAICFIRSGIITYNVSTGGDNTPEKGYHETMTLFWCKRIRHFIEKNSHLPFLELCSSFLVSPWASKDLPLQYYTREILFSTYARAIWVSPDKKEAGSDILF